MTQELKKLNKTIIDQQMTIDRQRCVINTQNEQLHFVLSNKPLWRLFLL